MLQVISFSVALAARINFMRRDIERKKDVNIALFAERVKGQLHQKLEATFAVYDADDSRDIDVQEMKNMLYTVALLTYEESENLQVQFLPQILVVFYRIFFSIFEANLSSLRKRSRNLFTRQ